MKKSKFTDCQIVTILLEVELDGKVGETCRKHGVSKPAHYKWKSRFAGMNVSSLGQLRNCRTRTRSSSACTRSSR